MSADEYKFGQKQPCTSVPIAATSLSDSGLTDDVRYPLDLVSPLTSLEQEFAHSPNILAKVAELRDRGYTHRRRVRGDGNCFYRAVGVAWLEALAARAQRLELSTLTFGFTWPDLAHFGDLVQEYQKLRQMVNDMMQARTEADARDIGAKLFESLLGDLRFDLCIVSLVRRSVADFLEQSAEDSDIWQTVVAQHGSMENFVKREVLPPGQEAEGASLVAAAQQFGLRMTIMQLDSTPGPIVEYTYPCEEYSSPLGIRIGLLFKPGHYEVLYHTDMPKFPEPVTFVGRCSFCRKRSSLLSGGLLVCFHRMCDSCQERPANAPRHASPEFVRCLACNGPTVPSLRRPCSAPAVQKLTPAFIHETFDSGTSCGSGASLNENIQDQSQKGVRATAPLHQPPSWRRSCTPPRQTSAAPAYVRRLPPSADPRTQREPFGMDASASTANAPSWPGRCPSSSAAPGRSSQSNKAQLRALCLECGEFYGSTATNNMCSQCFRRAAKQPPQDDRQIVNKRPPPRMRWPSRDAADCLECACGFSCGTRPAFARHVGRFPQSSGHFQLGAFSDVGEREEIMDTLVEHVPSQRSAWSVSRPRSNIEVDVSLAFKGSSCLGCTCGFTCGTTKALQRHLARHPTSAAHQPGMLEDVIHRTWEDPPVLDETNTISEEIMWTSAPGGIQLIV